MGNLNKLYIQDLDSQLLILQEQLRDLPFKVPALPFQESADILNKRAYQVFPSCIPNSVILKKVSKDETQRFREEFILQQKASLEEIIAKANKIIRTKLASSMNLPLSLDSVK